MPYKSTAEQGFLHANLPDVAAKFDAETPKGAYGHLPNHVEKAKAHAGKDKPEEHARGKAHMDKTRGKG